MNNRTVRQTLCVALITAGMLVLPSCGWLVGSWAGAPSEAEQRDRIIFSHSKHIVEQEVECGDCHGEMEASESLEDERHLPKESACMECHEKEDNCAMCHANPEAPATFIDQRMDAMAFSHKNHIGRKPPGAKADAEGATCKTCHAGMWEHTKVSQDQRPPMFQVCGTCHGQDFRKEDCLRCHKGLRGLDEKPLSIFDHGGDWMNRHSTAARGGEQVCGHCHTVETCNECHGRANAPIRPSLLNLGRVDANFRHRGDWMARHPIEARLDGQECLSCHDEKRCEGCHERVEVASQGYGKGNNPHPSNWLLPGSNSHGRNARRDPMACAACHDRGAATSCVTCHRVGGPGGDPHPIGWRSDLDKQSSPACIPCHM